KATHLMDPNLEKTVAASGELAPHAGEIYRELGVENPTLANTLGEVGGGVDPAAAIEAAAGNLAWIAVADIGVFFAVLLVGFAYVWKRGDLDWVRAVSRPEAQPSHRGPPTRALEPSASILSA
ncbi:MAG TPA: NADH-quinone oxidoreductase subunit A, partial [Rhodothermales bacterium]